MKTPPVYCGIDIAKDKLDASLAEHFATFANTQQGFTKLLAWIDRHLQGSDQVHVICEATGGYEQALVAFLHAQARLVSVVSPSRVRDLARSLGILAKTDRIDAQVLVRFGQVVQPHALTLTSEAQRQLAQLMTFRQQLQDQLQVLANQIQLMAKGAALTIANRLAGTLRRELERLDRAIDALVAAAPSLSQRFKTFCRVQGVGRLTSLAVLAYFPEAGQLNDKQAAALAGLAPRNRDSGRSSKPRSIGGGRAKLRKALYMAALTASKINPILHPQYQQLRANGKCAKVALTALMRKLIILLNSLASNPKLSLA